MASGTDVRTDGESDRTSVTFDLNDRDIPDSNPTNTAGVFNVSKPVSQTYLIKASLRRQRVSQQLDADYEPEVRMGILDHVKHKTRERARTVIQQGGVQRITRSEYLVTDPESGREVRVYERSRTWRCATCQGGHTERNPCWHIAAILPIHYNVNLDTPDPRDYKTDEPRNWTARRLANESWPTFFPWAITEIAATIPTDDGPPRRGRPAHSLRDLFIQAMIWKDAGDSMQLAKGRVEAQGLWGIMDHPPSYSYVSKFLGRPDTQTFLEKWLLATALLGQRYEDPEVALDGTQFASLHRTAPPRMRNGLPFRVAPTRLAIPVTTYRWNLVPAVAVPDNHGEAPWTLPLLHRTMSVFDVKRVAADRGYPFKEFTLHAETHGYEVTMPFKRGTNLSLGDAPHEEAYDRAIVKRALAPAAYWRQREKRKNAEAQNSSTKEKFGATLRCHKRGKQANEIRLQYLILNLKRLCQLSSEVGATLDFALAFRHVDQLPWYPLETLYNLFNGPDRFRYIQIMNPRASSYNASATGTCESPIEAAQEVDQ
jgi:hypothetical protein